MIKNKKSDPHPCHHQKFTRLNLSRFINDSNNNDDDDDDENSKRKKSETFAFY